MRARFVAIGILLALFVPLVVGAVVILDATVDQPPAQGTRVKGPHGIVGIYAGQSYAWVVPVDEERVVVIDAGTDPAARALRAELAGRTVVATLLTHAHLDQFAGVDALADAPLVHGPGEGSLVRGERLPGGFLAAWLARTLESPRLPEEVREVADGEVLAFGERRFRVVHVPGHTLGSVAYLWRDVLFTGDALLGGESLHLAPEAFSSDPEQARASVKRLLPLDFAWMADARVGVRGEARDALFAWVDEALADPTVSVADVAEPPEAASPNVQAIADLEGRYVQAPHPDARGLAPAVLVDDRGRRWVVADQPVAAHAPLHQRRVRVRGQATHPPLGHRALAGPWLTIDHIEAIDDEPPGIQRVRLGDVAAHDQGWVEVVGTLTALTALSDTSPRAEGRLGSVDLYAPASARAHLGATVTVLARVDGPALLATHVCVGDVTGCGRTAPPPEASSE